MAVNSHHLTSFVRPYHVVFVGGGLANGLAAFRLQQFRPDLRILILEAGSKLGGNHTWSYHINDLNTHQRGWIIPFVSKSWTGHNVVFPQFTRAVNQSYFTIRSNQFHDVITHLLGNAAVRLNAMVKDVTPYRVVLENGDRIEAECVLDGRGWIPDSTIPVGYQKFFGMDVNLKKPHGLKHPVIMDVSQPQKDGFRFFYLLPWSDSSILVEDTRYSESSDLDEEEFRQDVQKYIQDKGWSITSVNREEKGNLPIPLEGHIKAWDRGVTLTGTRAGLFHSVTGYSLPAAVRFAEEFVSLGQYKSENVYQWAKKYAKQHWESQSFFRFLNRMLFRAAEPESRFKILQKFYRSPEPMISRFYSGSLNSMDQVRILTGKPPVPLSKAVRCLFEKSSLQ